MEEELLVVNRRHGLIPQTDAIGTGIKQLGVYVCMCGLVLVFSIRKATSGYCT